MRKRPTVIEVAKRAGVSQTTVSFVLNDVPEANISEATRRKVIAAATELGYVPHASARRLKTGRSYMLGLVVCEAEHLQVDAFVPQVLYGMNAVARERGFGVLVETVANIGDPAIGRGLINARQVDALAVLNPRERDLPVMARLERHLPLVDIGLAGYEPPPSGQLGPAERAAQAATAHLIALGHRRIAHIAFAPPSYTAAAQRASGYARALTEHGLTARPDYLVHADFSAISGYQATQQLLALPEPPTAVFAGNDTIAFGVLKALKEAGLRAPEEVAVVGYDDIPLAAFADPPLTTMHTDPVGFGKRAADLLIKRVEGDRSASTIEVSPPVLVIRESCGAESSQTPATGSPRSAPRRF